jgi:hypothetical protein
MALAMWVFARSISDAGTTNGRYAERNGERKGAERYQGMKVLTLPYR